MDTDLSRIQHGDLLIQSKDGQLIKLIFKRVTQKGSVEFVGTTVWVKSIENVASLLYMLGFQASEPIEEGVRMLQTATEAPQQQ